MHHIKTLSIVFSFGVLCAGGLIKDTKNKLRDVKEKGSSKEITDYKSSRVAPSSQPGHRYQYGPVLYPDYRTFVELDDEEEEADDSGAKPGNLKGRSLASTEEETVDVNKAAFRRAVLLWPRPCGWEWDGSMYRWGPCNVFFGGPGYPW